MVFNGAHFIITMNSVSPFPSYIVLMNKASVVSVPSRVGVAVVRERRCKNGPGGKPQEANRRQAHVVHQMFHHQAEGQWLWGRGLLAGKWETKTSSVQIHSRCSATTSGYTSMFDTGAETEKFSILTRPLVMAASASCWRTLSRRESNPHHASTSINPSIQPPLTLGRQPRH